MSDFLGNFITTLFRKITCSVRLLFFPITDVSLMHWFFSCHFLEYREDFDSFTCHFTLLSLQTKHHYYSYFGKECFSVKFNLLTHLGNEVASFLQNAKLFIAQNEINLFQNYLYILLSLKCFYFRPYHNMVMQDRKDTHTKDTPKKKYIAYCCLVNLLYFLMSNSLWILSGNIAFIRRQ